MPIDISLQVSQKRVPLSFGTLRQASKVLGLHRLGVRRLHEIGLTSRYFDPKLFAKNAGEDVLGRIKLPDNVDRNLENALAFVSTTVGLKTQSAIFRGSTSGLARLDIVPAFVIQREISALIPKENKLGPDEDADQELKFFIDALQRGKAKLNASYDAMKKDANLQQAASFLDVLISICDDPMVTSKGTVLIKNQRLNTKGAMAEIVKIVETAITAMLSNMKTKECLSEIRDFADFVVKTRYGQQCDVATSIGKGSVAVVSEHVTTDEVATFPPNVTTILTENGSKNDHPTLLGKTRGILCITKIPVSKITTGTPLIANGWDGSVIVNPSPHELNTARKLRRKMGHYATAMGGLERFSNTLTLDGRVIHIGGCIGTSAELDELLGTGAVHGPGLIRSEEFYMCDPKTGNIRESSGPTEQEAVNFYITLATKVEEHKLVTAKQMKLSPDDVKTATVIRTLDLGGGKYLKFRPFDENLPERGIGLCRKVPTLNNLFEEQIRHILIASGEHPSLAILFPFVRTLEEFEWGKSVIRQMMQAIGKKPFNSKILVGATIENPEGARNAGEIAQAADFMKIGSNDMTAYTLGIQRETRDPAALARWDELHPDVLSNYTRVFDAGMAHNKITGVCGDLPTEWISLPILIGMGMNSVDVPSISVIEVKHIARNLRYDDCRQLVKELVNIPTSQEVRAYTMQFILKHMRERWSGLQQPPVFKDFFIEALRRSAGQ
ncbi:MAG: hypothetical protein NTZ10_07445 [Candidatus Saganbacteria bacterium]|nr:hypothetical protein [Candidatus Saganbacteria bacterium]